MYGSEPKIKSHLKTLTCISAKKYCVLGSLHFYPERRADKYHWVKNAADCHKPFSQIHAEFATGVWLGCRSLNWVHKSVLGRAGQPSFCLINRSVWHWTKYAGGGKTIFRLNFFTHFLPLRVLPEAPDLYFFGGAISAVHIDWSHFVLYATL